MISRIATLLNLTLRLFMRFDLTQVFIKSQFGTIKKLYSWPLFLTKYLLGFFLSFWQCFDIWPAIINSFKLLYQVSIELFLKQVSIKVFYICSIYFLISYLYLFSLISTNFRLVVNLFWKSLINSSTLKVKYAFCNSR